MMEFQVSPRSYPSVSFLFALIAPIHWHTSMLCPLFDYNSDSLLSIPCQVLPLGSYLSFRQCLERRQFKISDLIVFANFPFTSFFHLLPYELWVPYFIQCTLSHFCRYFPAQVAAIVVWTVGSFKLVCCLFDRPLFLFDTGAFRDNHGFS